MTILWFNWKDKLNPAAGGAELVTEELAKRLAKDGHEVILVTAGFAGAKDKEVVDGYKIIRLGNRWTVYWRAFRFYKKYLVGWADLVIDEINTIPFFCKFYVKEKNIIFIHQPCQEVWFYQMLWPLSWIGYGAEWIYMRLLNNQKAITVSESTKQGLIKLGFKTEKISIISEGIELTPVVNLFSINKYEKPTMLCLGTIRSMKRTDQVIKAFEITKTKIQDLQLIIAGNPEGKYGEMIKEMIVLSPYSSSIKFLGRVNQDKKIDLMQRSHILAATSIKEGWCLAVTEANSQGTPAVVYDVDGLRDSVKNNETGIVCKENNPGGMAKEIVELLNGISKYESMRKSAWEWSREINFEKCYKDFINIING